jgi:putative methyltransferase (TIGR04325 family)
VTVLVFMNKSSLKTWLRSIIPPFIISIFRGSRLDYKFSGDYSSWNQAVSDSTGYDSDLILDKVRDSLLKVKEGKAAFERDSVLFDHIEYSFPVLAALLKIALENNGELRILDFGGSLGSSYYQYKDFLSCVHTLEWSIVEQPKFVECGKQFFQNDQLRFYSTIEECISEKTIDVILLLSVIQYLENPLQFLDSLRAYRIPYILIDRTSIIDLDRDLLTVQQISEKIYKASYPAWFIREENLLKTINSQGYTVIFDFLDQDQININSSIFKGYFMGLKNEK